MLLTRPAGSGPAG